MIPTRNKSYNQISLAYSGSDSMSRLNGMSNRGMGNKIRDFIGKTIYQVQCETIVR